jgi:hypothetical protein
MWAMLDYDNETVIACMTPDIDITLKKVQQEINGRILIPMTIENSPAYVSGKYKDGKFYPPKGVTNG